MQPDSQPALSLTKGYLSLRFEMELLREEVDLGLAAVTEAHLRKQHAAEQTMPSGQWALCTRCSCVGGRRAW